MTFSVFGDDQKEIFDNFSDLLNVFISGFSLSRDVYLGNSAALLEFLCLSRRIFFNLSLSLSYSINHNKNIIIKMMFDH